MLKIAFNCVIGVLAMGFAWSGLTLTACAQDSSAVSAWELITAARAAIVAGESAEAELLLGSAIETAQNSGEQTAHLTGALELAALLISQVRLAEAAKIAALAAQTARELDDTQQTAQLYLRLGSVWRVIGKYGEASSALVEAHALFSSAGNVAGQASTLLSLGTLADLSGDLEIAAEYFSSARQLYRQLGDTPCVAQCYSNQAYALSRLGEMDRAIANFQQAIYLFQQLRQTSQEAEAHIALGAVYQQLDDPTGAQGEFETALGLLDANRYPVLAAQAAQGIGTAMASQQQWELAAEQLDQAWRMFESAEATEELRLLLNQMEPVWDKLGQIEQLNEYHERLEALLQQSR